MPLFQEAWFMKTVRATSDMERALQSLVGSDQEVIIELNDRRLMLTAIPEYEIVEGNDVAPYQPDPSEESALEEALQDDRPPLSTAEVLSRLHERTKGAEG